MSFALRLLLSVGFVTALPGMALAQVDYSAGKTAQQLFASDCSACHRSPEGLAKGRDAHALAGFLREHYTTGAGSAGRLGSYLAGIGGRAPSAARGTQPAAPGAGTPATAAREPRPPGAIEGERAKPGEVRRAKLTPAEIERENAKAAAEAVQAKLRGYATAGEEAKVKPATPTEAAPAIQRPSATAEPADQQPAAAGREPKPDAGVPSGGVTIAPSASEPAASAPGAPTGERPPATPPG
jgi:hypothetical protein